MKLEDMRIGGEELLSDKVADALRTLIVNQVLKPGSRLVQEEISEKLGVSRMPLRDAFKKLAMEGLVEIDPRKGVSVVQMTPELFHEVYSLRAMLEPMAISMSCKLLDEKEIAELEDLAAAMGECLERKETEKFSRLNGQFHKLLRSKSSWKHLNRFVETLWNGIPPYTPAFVEGQAEQSHLEHRLMIDAIRRQDWEELESLSRNHIQRSRDTLLEYLKKKNYFDGGANREQG